MYQNNYAQEKNTGKRRRAEVKNENRGKNMNNIYHRRRKQ
jgi:hypothetical protein